MRVISHFSPECLRYTVVIVVRKRVPRTTKIYVACLRNNVKHKILIIYVSVGLTRANSQTPTHIVLVLIVKPKTVVLNCHVRVRMGHQQLEDNAHKLERQNASLATRNIGSMDSNV